MFDLLPNNHANQSEAKTRYRASCAGTVGSGENLGAETKPEGGPMSICAGKASATLTPGLAVHVVFGIEMWSESGSASGIGQNSEFITKR